MIRLIGLLFLAFLVAFLFIYGVGLIWLAFSLYFFPEHFENFQALNIEGRLIERFSFIITFFIALIVATKRKLLLPNPATSIPLKIYQSLKMMFIVSLSVIFGFISAYVFGLLTINVESIFFANFSSILYQFFIIAIVNNFMITLGEEMVYRGIIFVYLLRKTDNLYTSLLISALVFSLLHFNYSQPISFLLAFTGGWIFAYSYHFSKTLFVPVGMHFSYNFFMEIFQSEDKDYIKKILKTDVVYIEGIGDWFAIFRLLFLLLIAVYIVKKYGSIRNKEQ